VVGLVGVGSRVGVLGFVCAGDRGVGRCLGIGMVEGVAGLRGYVE